MCGIAGVFFPKGCTPKIVDLDAMSAVMRHRGPDGTEKFSTADKSYQAVFNRLAIIDLKTGDQPIVERGGKRVLMGNGEIYNYVELRAREASYPYQTQGDMEVVLPLAMRHGNAFVDALEGMYALALFDANDHSLTLVRDRFGIKPLYWASLPSGGIIFASEIKALFASGLIAPAVDEDAVDTYMLHGYVPAPQTLYKSIHKLPAAHMLTMNIDGDMTVVPYWRAAPGEGMPPAAEIPDYLDSLLAESVRMQLRSDVPVGALLSGGIDSGLVVAHAANQSSQPINTFTVSFDGARVDEAPLAQAVADRYGTTHRRISVNDQSIADSLPMLAWHMEEPLFDPSVFPNYLIEAALREHVTVALNGAGGDELFAGYHRYFQTGIERKYLNIPGMLRRNLLEPLIGLGSPDTAWKLGRAEKFFNARGTYLNDHTTQFPPALRGRIGNRPSNLIPAQQLAFQSAKGPNQTRALIADMETYLAEDLMLLLDRTSMASSVEGRVPFLDRQLCEAALAVTTEMRTPGDQQKALLRGIARKHLPSDVINAPKQGFTSPVAAWIKGPLGKAAKLILTDPAALARGWWSNAGIELLYQDPTLHAARIYTLLMLELSVRTFCDTPLSDTAPSQSLMDMVDG